MESQIYAKNRAELRRWLTKHHNQAVGLWLVFDKGVKRQLSYDDIVEELLCFGWVDSKPGKVSNTQSRLYIAPRKPKSNWSAINKQRVARLEKAGLMTAAGKAVVGMAKKSGTWNALDAVEALSVPADLAKAFKGYALAADNFAAFPKSVKRSILEWILNAKKPDTRAQRVIETARLAHVNKRANQWRQ